MRGKLVNSCDFENGLPHIKLCAGGESSQKSGSLSFWELKGGAMEQWKQAVNVIEEEYRWR